MEPGRYKVEVRPRLPKKLSRLQELANNLLYSWDHSVRGIFSRLDPSLWERVHHNPKMFLRRVSQQRLNEAAANRAYMTDYHRALANYDAYLTARPDPEITHYFQPRDLVAYFCAEFGFHESFPIYSGGLGILAADHCKAASDLGLPFVAVGLLYQQGYFNQTIDADGRQVAQYHSHYSDELPIQRVQTASGPLTVEVPMPGRIIKAQVWEARAGHIRLYLLDTRVSDNAPEDQDITLQLYGGDEETRIQQELVLGVGGSRALAAIGLSPTIWHINEGHASFQIIDRCRMQMASGLDFASALEVTAATTLFTTHTPVPAGHDIFPRHLISGYLEVFAQSTGITLDSLFALGATPDGEHFNMTTLGLRGSRYHNGVSRIHGEVASRMEGGIWPQIPPEENPLGYITNGVHVPTFLAPEWISLFDIQAPTWRSELRNARFWDFVDRIPDYHYWGIHQALKQQMFDYIRDCIRTQHARNGTSHAITEKMLEPLHFSERDCLVIGFARRFATYKRATLIFSEMERLKRLLTDAQRPILLVFAGKAHPKDKPGQQLIKVIHDLSCDPDLLGRILLLENYDQAMARRLLTGVDVWMNTPEYPKEASGTSGEKAAMNGALNLSILDGWWAEGYNGENGWAIRPRNGTHDENFRNREEARALLDILQHQVIPLYYDQSCRDYSRAWIQKSKASMKAALPQFNAQRMVMDYARRYYAPAAMQHRTLTQEGGQPAQKLSQWKQNIREKWAQVSLHITSRLPRQCFHGEEITLVAEANLNGIHWNDIRVECLAITEGDVSDKRRHCNVHSLRVTDSSPDVTRFQVTFVPPFSGVQEIQLRMFPYHPALSHPFEMGAMVWA